MKTYFALFLIAATASLILTPLLRRFCERYRLVDEPKDNRRVHQKAVPRLGGVAIFLAILIALSVLVLVNNLLTRTLHPELRGIAGFLRYNFSPASIFLGDSGSLFIGFALAALSIQGSQKASTAVAVAIPILACGLPVVDAGVTIARRFVSGKPIFQGDREHIHHMLLARGWSQRRVALVLYGVSALFGLSAMLFVNSGSGLTAVVLFVIGVAVVLAIGRLRYHEVDELRASFKRNIGERRARATNNLRLRRACQSVASATTIDELFSGMLEILELGEFGYATVQFACHGQRELSEQVLAAGNGSMHNVTLDQGRISWAWKCDDYQHLDVAGSAQFWTMRLPLVTYENQLGYMD